MSFHLHTEFSYDGYNSFQAVYQCAKELGLGAIAITDHDTFDGVVAFRRWLLERKIDDIELIPAEEVTCSDGTHIIGLFTHEKLQSGTPLEVVRSIRNQGGFVYFPHPFRRDGIMSSNEKELALAQGHFFEIFNAKIDNSFNLKAQEELQYHPNLIPIGGSDAHYNLDIRKCYCEIPHTKNIYQSVAGLLEERKIKIIGKASNSTGTYFPMYYRYKNLLNLPQFIRNSAKSIFPMWKNFKERNQSVTLTEIYSSL